MCFHRSPAHLSNFSSLAQRRKGEEEKGGQFGLWFRLLKSITCAEVAAH